MSLSHYIMATVWITFLLLTCICRSNTCKCRIVISRCPPLAALVFWMSAIICFGLENIWCYTGGIHNTSGKRKSALTIYCKSARCFIFCPRTDLDTQALYLLLHFHSPLHSWLIWYQYIFIGLLFLGKGEDSQVPLLPIHGIPQILPPPITNYLYSETL